MVFSSFTFLFLFLPITLFFYFIVKNRKWRNVILCLFSLLFYAWGEPVYILLMLFSIVFNFFGAILIDKSKKRKLLLAGVVSINILALVIFKYTGFLINNVRKYGKIKFNFTYRN